MSQLKSGAGTDLVTTELFVGIDSGGTRSNVAVGLAGGFGGSPVAELEVDSGLSGSLPSHLVGSVMSRLFNALDDRLCDEVQLKDARCNVWISAAGYTQETRADYIEAVRTAATIVSATRICTVGIGNDAVSLLLGSRADAVVVAGTGSNILVRSEDGFIHQVGGCDWVASDTGSGFWIGLRAIRRAYQDLINGVESELLKQMCTAYNVDDCDEASVIVRLRELSIADRNTKRGIAAMAAGVFAAAERGDVSARKIIEDEAECLADSLVGALQNGSTRLRWVRGVVMEWLESSICDRCGAGSGVGSW